VVPVTVSKPKIERTSVIKAGDTVRATSNIKMVPYYYYTAFPIMKKGKTAVVYKTTGLWLLIDFDRFRGWVPLDSVERVSLIPKIRKQKDARSNRSSWSNIDSASNVSHVVGQEE